MSSTQEKTILSTEEKIKNAAHIVFQKKGFVGTTTRDIAKEAKENLASINYYFRSKENLFRIVMIETMQDFMQSMFSLQNDTTTSLEEKLSNFVDSHIKFNIQNPEVALFVFHELRCNSGKHIQQIMNKGKLLESVLYKQLKEHLRSGNNKSIHPFHFILNIMGMTILPFMAKPLIQSIAKIKDNEFNELMEERKKFIPIWMESILNKNLKI